MSTVLEQNPKGVREYGSGDVVEPGVYIDVESGAVVQIYEREELPEGVSVVRYARKFRRLAVESQS